MSRLLYRRQFLFSNRRPEILEGWHSDTLKHKEQDWYLVVHPDLPVFRGKNKDVEIVLMGYMLDPVHPSLSDRQIFDKLLKSKNFEELIEQLDPINGRFVLAYSDSEDFRVLTDFSGFREVFYCITGDRIMWGSTPSILSWHGNLPVNNDPDIINLHESDAYVNADYTWVGEETLVKGIRKLLPNHYLDVIHQNPVRYWPVEPIKSIDIDQCAEECARILKGTIDSAVRRYPLHMGLTSGWDSRLLLASTRDWTDKIFYYINRPSSFFPDHKDLRIAQKIAESLGFELNIVDIPDEVDKDFQAIFRENNVMARDILMPVFFEVFRRKWEETYTISGTLGNGLARVYMRLPEGIDVTGVNVARLLKYHHYPYAVRSLESWVNEAGPVCRESGINIMDMFQLEQENAHWAGLASSEQDIAREEIRPFSNRRLIRLLWGLEDKDRYQYHAKIYLRIMEILWKEVLAFPFNPSRRSNGYRLLRAFGIEQWAYYRHKKRKYMKTFQ